MESRPGWAWVVVQLDTFRYQHGGLRPSSLMEGWEKRIKASIEKPEKYGWSKASKINEVGWVKEVPEDGLKMNPAIKEWPESADKLKVWPKAATEEDEEVVVRTTARCCLCSTSARVVSAIEQAAKADTERQCLDVADCAAPPYAS